MKSAQMVIQGEDIRKIIDKLKRKEFFEYKYETDNIVVLAEEEYYIRIESNLMSMYIFNFVDERTVSIELVVGGGQGEMSISWGAENSENKRIANSIIELCEQNAWEVVSIQPEEFKQSLEKTKAQLLLESVGKWFKGKE